MSMYDDPTWYAADTLDPSGTDSTGTGDPDDPGGTGPDNGDPDVDAVDQGPADPDRPDHPAGADVVGDPDTSAGYWHQQEDTTTCAVAAQEFVLDETTGTDRTEADLVQLATEQGWYIPGGGTPMNEVGNLLEHHGVAVDRQDGANLDDLRFALADRDGVIVAVDSDEIWTPDPADPLEGYPGVPGQGADHAVQVTGLDYRNPDHPMVILNDPGLPEGAGMRVPMDVFWNAWEDSGRFMVRSAGGRRD
ncbi:hypothetical protein V6U90_08400 [Micromonospora sp. CPCC 206060]|uniref:hypothetical protein n=1 Tax=Micromonospora sp. CPCC 206060 TaxID=3122406 RepID=UPI002FF43715